MIDTIKNVRLKDKLYIYIDGSFMIEELEIIGLEIVKEECVKFTVKRKEDNDKFTLTLSDFDFTRQKCFYFLALEDAKEDFQRDIRERIEKAEKCIDQSKKDLKKYRSMLRKI